MLKALTAAQNVGANAVADELAVNALEKTVNFTVAVAALQLATLRLVGEAQASYTDEAYDKFANDIASISDDIAQLFMMIGKAIDEHKKNPDDAS